MSVYGSATYSLSEGMIAIAKAASNPGFVQLVKENDEYYVTAEALEDYMFNSCTLDVTEAVDDICRVNNITDDQLTIVGRSSMFESEFIAEGVRSTAYDNAAEESMMTMKQAVKYFNQLERTMKNKAETVEQIDDCIKGLKICVKDMQQTLARSKTVLLHKDRIKYAIKGVIPFNKLFEIIRRNDWTGFVPKITEYGITAASGITVLSLGLKAGKAAAKAADKQTAKAAAKAASATSKAVAGAVGGAAAIGVSQLVTVGVRFVKYEKMLQNCIDQTNEAIAYLERKKKTL